MGIRKKYTWKDPANAHKKRKPTRGDDYIKAFNRFGNVKETARFFNVTVRAIDIYFKRNGIKIKKIAYKESGRDGQ